MKICFVSNCYSPKVIGGAELIAQAQAESCRDVGHDVFVVTLNPEGIDQEGHVNGIPVYRLATRNVYWPFASADVRKGLRKRIFHLRDAYNSSAAKSVAVLIDRLKPDVVVTHNICGFSTALWSQLNDRSIPIVHVLHDYYLMCPSSTRYRGGRRCGRQCDVCRVLSVPKLRSSSCVAAVVGVSKYVLDAHIQSGYFSNSTKHVIYNGRALFDSDRDAHTISTDGPLRVGFIGRVEHVKGVEVLLDAVVSDKSLNVEVKIAGRAEPDYLAYLQGRYDDSRIEYIGFVRAPDFYRSIDVLVVPSLWDEPLPGVVYEPWEFGIPVVASDVGGIPEMIRDAGVGWLIPPGDSTALRHVLESVSNDRMSLSDAAEILRVKRRNYLPERASSELLAVLNSVVQDRVWQI